MKYYDPALDMHIVETQTRSGFIASVKRIHTKHYLAKFPILHANVDKEADTIEYLAFTSEKDKASWLAGNVTVAIISQHVGAWEGYGGRQGKGIVCYPS